MSNGLNDFLKHIKSNPQNDVLVDRFTALVMELDAKARQPYFEKLFELLADNNPHGALRAAYFNLQTARAQGSGTPLEVEALQWIERAFSKLGKTENAALVRDELTRIKKRPPPPPERKRKKTVTEVKPKVPEADSATQRLSTQRLNFIANLYESFAQQLLDALTKELRTFQGPAHSEAAAAHIIQAFRKVYEEMKQTLRNAVAVFGHNPLLVDDKDRFRDDLIQVFLKSALLNAKKDRIAAQRARLVASLLTAWFDQQQNMPEGSLTPDQERLQNKLLLMAVAAVLRFED